jgi:hypothetical protein
MKASSFLITLSLILPSLQALSDCPRVLGQQDDRRANAGCLIIRDQQVLLITHRWGGKLGVLGEPSSAENWPSARHTGRPLKRRVYRLW